mmetsp:Transcript_53543/g.148857  ORF Transcript_53543/g.148857 Transcript_53543/m.148857 type:complete len:269 (-) Transcript_53543:54-860(-)
MSLASGAHPTSTFPCDHLVQATGEAAGGGAKDRPKWSAPVAGSPLETLMVAVEAEDWARHFAEGNTKIQAQAAWSAGLERCSALQCLCRISAARSVLEVGSFCGVTALALAEILPENGEVLSLEHEAFFADFGRRYQQKSQHGHKINTVVGSAHESLDNVVQGVKTGSRTPFDLVVIDADKANMKAYFDIVTGTPGLLSDRAVVCVDTTPFKGQPPERYVKYGQTDHWEPVSGEAEIDAFRASVFRSEAFSANEFGGLVVVQRVQQAK